MIYHGKQTSLAGILPEIVALVAGIIIGGMIVTDTYFGVAILLAFGSVGIVTVYVARRINPQEEQMNMVGIAPSVFAAIMGVVVGALVANPGTILIAVILFAVVFGMIALLYALDPLSSVKTKVSSAKTEPAEPPPSDPATNGEDGGY